MFYKKPSIFLHYGATHDEIVVDGTTFHRNELSKEEFKKMRTIVIDVLLKIGAIKRRKKHV